ncbi:nose resistant to fluoxetine protein 6-like [Uranotaenia lowii]|uniref:nose resistant to fluoxetine protein 6-like n=1 Tax=Uranotaenia lowii TaxID=190385 RepID=UPI0024795CA8|nr:nose resistant to fluoxetine protein 6-like [Uranotaenia lowii]
MMYIIDPIAFDNVAEDRANYGDLVNICVNYQLNKSHGLVAYSEIEYCFRPGLASDLDWPSYLFLGLSLIILFVCFASSSYDSWINKAQSEDHYTSEPICRRTTLLTAFSIKRNWYRLAAPSKDDLNQELQFFQAFRFLTMVLVILGHSWNMLAMIPLLNPEGLERKYYRPATIALINGTQIVQTFFTIGGFMLALQTCNVQAKSNGGKLSWITIPTAIGFRYLRLTPVYAYVVLLHATWLSKLQDGPVWPRGVLTEERFCRKNWWTNMLFLNNYVNSDEPCLQQTWYLACDFQLFVLGMISLVIISRNPHLKFYVLSSVIIAAYIIPGMVIYFGKYDGVFINKLQDERFLYWYDSMYRHVYIPLHSNMGCYFGGIIFGTIYSSLRKTAHRPSQSLFLRLIWHMVVPVAFLSLISYRFFYENYFPKPSLWMAIYYPIMKHLWIFLFTFLVYGVIGNYNGLIKRFLNYPAFLILGRLTFCAYLSHMFVLKNASKFISVVVLSYLMALVLALMLEFPISSLQKLISNKTKS